MWRGVKHVVEAEKGRERERTEVEDGHEHVERVGKEWRREEGREEPKRAREKQESKRLSVGVRKGCTQVMGRS